MQRGGQRRWVLPGLQVSSLGGCPPQGSFDRQLRGRISCLETDWASLQPWAGVAGALGVITAGPLGTLAVCPCTHRSAHHVAQAKVEATLLVHGIVQPRELRQGRPVMGKGIVPQAVIGTVRGHVGATSDLQWGQLKSFLELSWWTRLYDPGL